MAALSITNLDLNAINQHADGQPGSTTAIDNADLNSSDVRTWGNLNSNATYSTVTGLGGYGLPGVSQTNESEIAMGEFRGAEAPTVAFSGTMTAQYVVTLSGDQYIPDSYASGYRGDLSYGAHTNTSFSGTIGGVYSTQHFLAMFYNSGFGSTSGVISMVLQNPRPAATTPYSSTATDWTSVDIGSHNFTRASANNIYVGGNSNYYYYQIDWGRYFPNPQIYYNMSTYFGNNVNSTTNYAFKINL